MQIKIQPMGYTQTNCYIVTIDGKDIIIDPGMGATDWVSSNVTNPVAILNTHGHYDHVWSDKALKERFDIPIYIHRDDAFMLRDCPLGQPTPPVDADMLFESDTRFSLSGIEVTFRHFPGHTPGCGIFEIGDLWFSGDFLFKESIGRWDFPYSDGKAMLRSIEKVLQIRKDYTLYPGHGDPSTLKAEQRRLPMWAEYVRSTL